MCAGSSLTKDGVESLGPCRPPQCVHTVSLSVSEGSVQSLALLRSSPHTYPVCQG